MILALVVVPILMFLQLGSFKQVASYIAHSDESSKKIVQIQNDIPNILKNIKSVESQAKIQVLIESLNETQDRSIGSAKLDEKLKMDLQIQAFFNNDLSAAIFSRDFAKRLSEALGANDFARLENLLAAWQHIPFVAKDRLSWFSGVSLVGIISALAWGLGYFGQPHILVRFMSIRSTKDIPAATFIGIAWMAICLIAACFIGMLGVAYVNKFNLSLQDPERIFIVMSQLLFNPWIAGILLSAILAAIMSTASSQLLVSSSTIAEDFYKKIFKQEASEAMVLRLGKVGVLVVALIAFVISTDKNSSVLSIVAYAWAGFGASFGSVMLFSLFWSRMTRIGAIAGMISGAVVVVAWKQLFADTGVYEIIPGFVVASLAIIIFSLASKVRDGTKAAYDKMLENL